MSVNMEDLPLKTLHQLMYADERYLLALERSINMCDQIPYTTVPGPSEYFMVPWMIEAPLNSIAPLNHIEIIEAILKPSQPFKDPQGASHPTRLYYKKT